MAEVGELFERASAVFEKAVAQVNGPQWERPTVCDITVHGLVRHVIAGNQFAVRLLAGATADEALSGLTEEADTANSDLLQQVVESCAAQTNAFKTADQDRLLHHPSGEIDFETFDRFRHEKTDRTHV